MKRKTILTIDDDPITIKSINEYLGDSKFTFEVLQSNSVQQALEISNNNKPDLIIVNCELPGMSGITILKEIKNNPLTTDVPVIVTASPLAFVNDLYLTLSEWPVHYLGKPINKTDLNIQVNTALALTDPLKEIEKQKKFISYIKQFTARLMDAIPTPLFYQNKDNTFFGYNKAMETLFNKDRGTKISHKMQEVLPKPVVEILEKGFKDLKQNPGDIHFTTEIKKENESRFVMVVCSAFKSAEGEYAGCIGAITDITEIIKNEKKVLNELNTTYNKNEEVYKNNIEKIQAELNSRQRELSIHLGLLKDAEKEMAKMIEDIKTLKPYLNDEGKTKLPNLVRKYKYKMDDDSWLHLQSKFEETNHSFFELLEKNCPTVTKTEKTLCAYIKMNLTSSEISKITHRSLNSINVALARLRSKLNLADNKALKDFILELRKDPQTISS